MLHTISPIYAPVFDESEGFIPDGIDVIGYELFDQYGSVIARAETRDELLPYVYGIEDIPPLPVPKNKRLTVAR